jgi:hypothetical protein
LDREEGEDRRCFRDLVSESDLECDLLCFVVLERCLCLWEEVCLVWDERPEMVLAASSRRPIVATGGWWCK